MASLSEGKGRNYGKKGGQGSDKPVRITPFDRREARAKIQDPSRTNKPGDAADIVRRFFNVKDEPGTVSSNVSRDELLKRLESQTNQRLSKSAQAAADIADVEPDAARIRNQAGEVAQRSRETKPPQRRPLGDTTKGGPVKTMRLGDPGAPSKEAARTLQRMTTADPTTTARLQSNLRKADTAPKPAPKPEAIKQSDVSKRAARFRQSFGTPTGADPFTGKPTYKPLEALTNLPKGRGGTTPSPEAYSKVTVGDLDVKRFVRTTGPQGVPTDRGAENFLLNRETKGALGGRNARQISPEQGKAALERVKGFMADPKEVAKVKGQIQREVGGRRAQLETPPSRPSRSTAAATGSTTARPSTPSLTTTTLKPSRSAATSGPKPTGPAPTSTVTKVRQALNIGIARPAPKPEFGKVTTKTLPAKSTAPASSPDLSKTQTVQPKAPSTAGQNLEFTKSKTGSFTYKPERLVQSSPAATSSPPAPKPAWKQLAPEGDFKPVTGRVGSRTFKPEPRTSKIPEPKVDPNLGSRSTSVRSGQSSTIRPSSPSSPQRSGVLKGKDIKRLRSIVQSRRAGTGGAVLSGAFGAWDAWDRINQMSAADKAAGGTGKVSFKDKAREITTAIGGAFGGGLGATAGAAVAAPIPVPGARIAGGLYGGQKGYEIGSDLARKGFDASYDTIAGASKTDKDWMKWANRATQSGTSASDATFKRGNKAIIRDKQGNERIGYLAYKDGKAVYKHANAPKSLQYTSSNPFERIGRAVMPGYYAGKDEAARRSRVAAFKAGTSK